jgi:hypothetical protein
MEINPTLGAEDLQVTETAPSDSKQDKEGWLVRFGINDDVGNPSVPTSSQPAVSLMNYLTRIWSDDGNSQAGDEEWKKRKLPDAKGENEQIWTRLFDIWNEDWFFRSWILQEAVLGKKVILLIDDAACSLDFIMKFWELAKKRGTPEILKHGRLADKYARIMHLSPVSSMEALRHLKHPKPVAARLIMKMRRSQQKLQQRTNYLILLSQSIRPPNMTFSVY